MARIKVSSAKAKGRALQQWVCQKISDALHIPWGRDDDYLIQSRPMGQIGTDVILKGTAKELSPFSIECKSGEHWSIHEAIKQAKANQKDGTQWLVVLKNKGMKTPIVVLDSEFFFRVMAFIANDPGWPK